MNRTGIIYTTADGWSIDTGLTIAARAAWWIKLAGGEAKAAELYGIPIEKLRSMLADHRLDPAPVVTPEAKAVLAKPLPVFDAPSPEQAKEADLIRFCEFCVSVTSDFQKLDWVAACTRYKPPADFAAARDALADLRDRVENVITDIPATTLEGIRAKGRALMAGFDPGAFDLNSLPLAHSLLADCGVDDWRWNGSPNGNWVGEQLGTVPVSDGEPVTLKPLEAALAG